MTDVTSGGRQHVGLQIIKDEDGDESVSTYYGIAELTTVHSGGSQRVNTGGTALQASIENGGTQTILGGGSAVSTELYGRQNISGGSASLTTVYTGGGQTVTLEVITDPETGNVISTYYGVAEQTTVHSSGIQEVNTGGTALLASIESGGTQNIRGGGSAVSTELYGRQNVSGGFASLTTVYTGGEQYVASQTLYDTSGVITDVYLGVANDTTLDGGIQYIVAGGETNGTIVNAGSAHNIAGTANSTTVNGGIYTQGMTGSSSFTTAAASDLSVNTGGSAYIWAGTVTNATVGGDMLVGSHDVGLTSDVTLAGNVVVSDSGRLQVSEGAHTENADLTLTGTGMLYLDNAPTVTASTTVNATQYSMGAMTMNGGGVQFDTEDGYADLTVDSLDGSGTFYMNTEIATLQGDHLTVTGEANGDYGVVVADTGVSPTSDASLRMISTGGGDAAFTLANTGGVVDVGTYQYHLVDNGNGTWSLTPYVPTEPVEPVEPPIEPTEPVEPVEPTVPPVEPVVPPSEMSISPSTAAVLAMATADPLIFKAEMDVVRDRMDLVRSASRYTEISHDTNLWAHYNFNNFSVSSTAGAAYDMTVSGFTLGMDRSVALDNAIATFGGFTSYSRSDLDFDRGGNGDVDSYSVGAYASYLHNNGFYADSILKANRFGNDVHAQMTSGSAAYGDYNTNGIGMHLQGGKYFYFGESYIAPYVALSTFTSDSNDYTLSNGMKARVDNQKSVIGEAGVQMGHHFEYNGAQIQPYFRAAVAQEFIDDNEVRVNDDTFTNDLSGARGVYQVGVNAQVTDTLAVNAHTSYSHGDHVDEPLTVDLGVSWKF
nr:autotransporter outer membrane beta-barrel domain-containing protein [Buttiauxella sp. 3AFRM03]